MARIVVVGAGPVGLSVALELLEKGHEVRLIAEKLPGQGTTGDQAAGIGCIFKPSSPLVGELVLRSYPDWMRLAEDSTVPSVSRTRLITSTKSGSMPAWADYVEGYHGGYVSSSYWTYAFHPHYFGYDRLKLALGQGVALQHRPLRANEVDCVRSGRSLPESDYTVLSIGLNSRVLRPDFHLFGIRGVLVHFGRTTDGVSFMDEDACSYAISRPYGMVVGGTFDRHVETCSDEERDEIGQKIVCEANGRFGLKLDFGDRTRITVGYRPAIDGDPVLEFGNECAHVTGLGGQGWVASPALGRLVVDTVEQRLSSR